MQTQKLDYLTFEKRKKKSASLCACEVGQKNL